MISPQLVEDGVHERAELADLAGRAGERAVEHVEDAADEDDDAADDPQPGRRARTAPTTVIANPMRVSPFGRQAEPAHPERDRLEDLLDPAAGFVRDGHRTQLGDAEDRALARGELAERLLAQAADRLAAAPARLDDAGGAEAAEVPRHERLATARHGR